MKKGHSGSLIEDDLGKSNMLSAAKKENIKRGVGKYHLIMKKYRKVNVSKDKDFQRLYNGFYKVRRGKDWCSHYYQILEDLKTKDLSFEYILRALQKRTGNLEASFSSKMCATRNPNLPIIDSRVLECMNMALPGHAEDERIEKTVQLYNGLIKRYGDLLSDGDGEKYIKLFDEICPDTEITKVKKMDFILWQLGRLQ